MSRDPSASGSSAYDKAVTLLGARPHFRRELAAKLTARGFPADEIAAALDRLAAQGYVDDRRTAVELVAVRARRGEGRRRLAAELARRGAAPEAVEAALADLPDDDLPAARAAAARWVSARGGRGPSEREVAALARHLDRKGFSPRAIVTVSREARPASGSESESDPESDPETDFDPDS